MEKRLVGVLSLCRLFRDSEVFNMDLRAFLDFCINTASRADPYLWQRVLFASFILSLFATWCSL